mmetsp:Transcript_141128/g.246029  ORF Transcript_141128/g.246029 Transcript_141128/m.246029 type:complete len:216 (-) Transcript_141128:221-868(-)
MLLGRPRQWQPRQQQVPRCPQLTQVPQCPQLSPPLTAIPTWHLQPVLLWRLMCRLLLHPAYRPLHSPLLQQQNRFSPLQMRSQWRKPILLPCPNCSPIFENATSFNHCPTLHPRQREKQHSSKQIHQPKLLLVPFCSIFFSVLLQQKYMPPPSLFQCVTNSEDRLRLNAGVQIKECKCSPTSCSITDSPKRVWVTHGIRHAAHFCLLKKHIVPSP